MAALIEFYLEVMVAVGNPIFQFTRILPGSKVSCIQQLNVYFRSVLFLRPTILTPFLSYL